MRTTSTVFAASLYWLAYYCRGEPGVDETSKHLGLEPMGDHEPIPGGTVRVTGEQFERPALFSRQAMLWRRDLADHPSARRPASVIMTKLNLDRLFADCRDVGRHGCEPTQGRRLTHA